MTIFRSTEQRRDAGISIIEILIVIGISSVAITGLLSAMSALNESRKSSEINQELFDYIQTTKLLFKKENLCNLQILKGNLDTAKSLIAPDNIKIIPIQKVQSIDGTMVFDLSKGPQAISYLPQVKIAAIDLLVDQIISPTTTTARIKFSLSKTANIVGGSELARSFPVILTTDPTGKITDCSVDGESSNVSKGVPAFISVFIPIANGAEAQIPLVSNESGIVTYLAKGGLPASFNRFGRTGTSVCCNDIFIKYNAADGEFISSTSTSYLGDNNIFLLGTGSPEESMYWSGFYGTSGGGWPSGKLIHYTSNIYYVGSAAPSNIFCKIGYNIGGTEHIGKFTLNRTTLASSGQSGVNAGVAQTLSHDITSFHLYESTPITIGVAGITQPMILVFGSKGEFLGGSNVHKQSLISFNGLPKVILDYWVSVPSDQPSTLTTAQIQNDATAAATNNPLSGFLSSFSCPTQISISRSR